ncbi:MAG: hypothetical protein DI538_18020 [Azospira oryzae]|nr:MAG: hypothetical protein DI538_18020 [Azospira oryzae]
MRRVLVFFFCFFSLGIFAQNISLIDSLRKGLTTAAPRQKFAILNAIGFEYRYSYPDSTIFYCTRAFELGKELNLTKDLSKPLSFIGLATGNKGDYKSSIDYHLQAIEIAQKQQDSIQLAFGYNNLGRMFFDQGDVVRAYDNFIRAKDIFEQNGDASGLAYVFRSLANLYKSQNDFTHALEMSSKAYDLRRKIGEPRAFTSALLELGLVYQASGNTQEALNSFRKADSVATRIHDRVTKAELRLGMAEILFDTGDKNSAYIASKEVLDFITDDTNQRLFLRATLLQARYFYDKKEDAQALALLRKIMDEAESSGTPSFQRDASFFMAEIYKRKKNDTLYNEYFNKYRILNEMLQNTDLNRQIERLQFQLEIEKREKENELLKATQASSAALIAKQRLQNIALFISVISVAVIAVIIWINGRKRRLINRKLTLQNSHIDIQRKEISTQNDILSKNNQELQDLNQEKNTLMNIVAHDLKSPLNRIYGLATLMEMEENLSAEVKEYIHLMKDSTRSGLDLITDLLDVNELEEAKGVHKKEWINFAEWMENEVRIFQEMADAKEITIEYKSTVTTKIFSDAAYLERILDNLVSNAIKFSSRSTTIALTSQLHENQLIISVKDQGPGFSKQDRPFLFQKFKKLSARPTGGESSNGLGLAIVKTLVDRLNGKIDLNSETGKGSEFVIEIPVE